MVLDILRGLGIFGILLANITAFSNPDLAYYWPPALTGPEELSDGWIWLAQLVLVDGKFRGLFTLLFGAGMVLFADRAALRDRAGATARQALRLFWLALFGVAHFYLLFSGDILFSYAVGGALVLFALRWDAQRLLWLGAIWALAGALLSIADYLPSAIIEAMAAQDPATPGWPALQSYWAQALAEGEAQRAAMAGPHFADLVAYRWEEESWHLSQVLSLNIAETIPLILLGMGLYRAGMFTDGALRRRWRGRAFTALLAGLGANFAMGLWVLQAGFPPFATMAAFFGLLSLTNLPLILGGAVLLCDWALAIRADWLGERLAMVGRMALSNYIGTSLLMALIFQGWAFGQFGTMHRAELLLVVAIGWGLSLQCSRLWLGRFQQGPLEWLWRCLTYGKWVAIRRD